VGNGGRVHQDAGVAVDVTQCHAGNRRAPSTSEAHNRRSEEFHRRPEPASTSPSPQPLTPRPRSAIKVRIPVLLSRCRPNLSPANFACFPANPSADTASSTEKFLPLPQIWIRPSWRACRRRCALVRSFAILYDEVIIHTLPMFNNEAIG
jgi:hypothetical protein